jgi:Zn-finger nucleic acid-binding protein
MTERQGVEIDYCPKCRGVWLDRGELDKIIERSSSTPSSGATGQPYSPDPFDRHRHDKHDEHHSGHGYHRKKSWLGELFD